MDNYADLHIHSRYSDSDFSIEEVFKKASAASLRCISITDHDTTSHLKEARLMARSYDIELLDGIEVSTYHEDTEIHILGYGFDPESILLKDALSQIALVRRRRLSRIIKKLNELGLSVDEDDFFFSVKGMVPTRLHLGIYLAQHGYTRSLRDAFKSYLSSSGSAYVALFCFSVREVITIIKEAGGKAFLAHPHYIPESGLISLFSDWGLDGIEVIYPSYSTQTTNHFTQIADQLGLLKSGGSDFHGSYKKYTSIGKTKIPYEWVISINNAVRPGLH